MFSPPPSTPPKSSPNCVNGFFLCCFFTTSLLFLYRVVSENEDSACLFSLRLKNMGRFGELTGTRSACVSSRCTSRRHKRPLWLVPTRWSQRPSASPSARTREGPRHSEIAGELAG